MRNTPKPQHKLTFSYRHSEKHGLQPQQVWYVDRKPIGETEMLRLSAQEQACSWARAIAGSKRTQRVDVAPWFDGWIVVRELKREPTKRDLTYAVYSLNGRFWGVAWCDQTDISINSGDFGSYTEARKALQTKVANDPRGLRLKWFDGEHGGCVAEHQATIG